MYARNVTLHLKANAAPEFARTLETDVLPLLRKQNGFKDEITPGDGVKRTPTQPSVGSGTKSGSHDQGERPDWP